MPRIKSLSQCFTSLFRYLFGDRCPPRQYSSGRPLVSPEQADGNPPILSPHEEEEPSPEIPRPFPPLYVCIHGRCKYISNGRGGYEHTHEDEPYFEPRTRPLLEGRQPRNVPSASRIYTESYLRRNPNHEFAVEDLDTDGGQPHPQSPPHNQNRLTYEETTNVDRTETETHTHDEHVESLRSLHDRNVNLWTYDARLGSSAVCTSTETTPLLNDTVTSSYFYDTTPAPKPPTSHHGDEAAAPLFPEHILELPASIPLPCTIPPEDISREEPERSEANEMIDAYLERRHLYGRPWFFRRRGPNEWYKPGYNQTW